MFPKKFLLAIMAVVLTSLACSINVDLPRRSFNTGPTVTDQISVPLPSAASTVTDVELGFGAGELNLSPGAQNALISGDATYNVAEFKPVVSVTGNEVRISHQDVDLQGIPDFGDDIENVWNLAFGTAPINLTINAGAYKGRMELGGLALQGLHVTDGAAETEVTFSEPNQAEMGTLIYQTGASKVSLSGLCNANFSQMEFRSGAGDYTLEFSGELQRDASVDVKSGLSSVHIVVPQGVAARVSVTGGLTNVDPNDGWQKSGNEYVLSGDGPTLTIQVEMGAGNLELSNP